MNIKEEIHALSEEMLTNLGRLVAIDSQLGTPSEGKPFGEGPAKALEEGLKIAEELGFKTVNLDNYCGYAEMGEGDEIVGMLCVNTDLSTVRNINAMAQQLMACFDAAPTRTEPAPIEVESLSESTQELIDRSIAELLESRGMDVASLGQSDRVDVIRHLNGNGVFMLKGAVACAATALGISEPSVYRYLQKVRKEG